MNTKRMSQNFLRALIGQENYTSLTVFYHSDKQWYTSVNRRQTDLQLRGLKDKASR